MGLSISTLCVTGKNTPFLCSLLAEQQHCSQSGQLARSNNVASLRTNRKFQHIQQTTSPRQLLPTCYGCAFAAMRLGSSTTSAHSCWHMWEAQVPWWSRQRASWCTHRGPTLHVACQQCRWGHSSAQQSTAHLLRSSCTPSRDILPAQLTIPLVLMSDRFQCLRLAADSDLCCQCHTHSMLVSFGSKRGQHSCCATAT
jgi:hypothetical protein